MSISRRGFLRFGSLSALAAGFNLGAARLAFGQRKGARPAKGARVVPYQAAVDPAYYFTQDTFTPYLNSTFRVSRGKGDSFDAELVSVSDLRPRSQAVEPQAQPGRCFALTFRAGRRDAVPQGTYKFEHAALGRFSLFIVPGAASADGASYVAVINHLA